MAIRRSDITCILFCDMDAWMKSSRLYAWVQKHFFPLVTILETNIGNYGSWPIMRQGKTLLVVEEQVSPIFLIHVLGLLLARRGSMTNESMANGNGPFKSTSCSHYLNLAV